MTPIISFIIPTYNQAHTVGRAIESIYREFEPEMHAFEIIVIDDGSTDQLEDTIKALSKHRDSIKYIRTENRGPSAARNSGICSASGRLLFFLDSDDELGLLPKDCLNEIQAFEGQVAILDKQFRDGIDERRESTGKKIISADRALMELCIGGLKQGIGLGKLFSREFIVTNQLFFSEELTVGEDLIFIHSVLLHCEQVAVIGHDCVLYEPTLRGLSLRPPQDSKLEALEKKLHCIWLNADRINQPMLATLYSRILIPYAIKFNVRRYDTRIFLLANASDLDTTDKRISFILRLFRANQLIGRAFFSILRQAHLLKSSYARNN